MSTAIRLGTRSSELARWQADWVADQLRQRGWPVEPVWIQTTGDRRQEAISALGRTGLFTKEIQQALLDDRIDLAVHSLKDLPTCPVAGLRLAAVPARGPSGDALVSRQGHLLADLPAGSRVATGSRRRQAQLLAVRPDLVVEPVRGNVDTRLRKLARGEFEAMVLAEAGLRRLGLDHRITQLLPADQMLPAVGQGALGLEIRQQDVALAERLRELDCAASRAQVTAERTLLAHLQAGCLAPVGALSHTGRDGSLQLQAVVLSLDGRRRLAAHAAGTMAEAEMLGRRVAEQLLAQGAGELIGSARGN